MPAKVEIVEKQKYMPLQMTDLECLIERHRDYFTQYRGTFVSHVLEMCNTSNTVITRLFHTLAERFFEGEIMKGGREPVFQKLLPPEVAVHIMKVIRKAALHMAKDFIDHLLATSGKLSDAALFLDLVNRCLPEPVEEPAPKEPAVKTVPTGDDTIAPCTAKETSELMEYFKSALDRNIAIKLYNSYKGMAVCFPATIVEAKSDSVRLAVHKYQELAIGVAGYTIFRVDIFSQPIKALADQVSLPYRRWVALHDFFFVSGSMIERKFPRVQPKTDVPVSLDSGTDQIQGKLFDISAGGMSVDTVLPSAITSGTSMQVLVNLQYLSGNLRLPLDGENTCKFNEAGQLIIEAEVVSIVKGDDFQRVALGFIPDKLNEMLLHQYVTERTVEIIADLKNTAR